MSYYEKNPYYSPEAFGLKLETQLDMTKFDYSFDYRVIWSDDSGQIYTAYDSGCSCPTPFEDYDSIDKLDKVPQDVSWTELRQEAEAHGQSSDSDRFYDIAPDQNSIADYLKVLDRLEKPATGSVQVSLHIDQKVIDAFILGVAKEVRDKAQELIEFAEGLESEVENRD